jgi:hypothetical protein
VPSVGTEQRRIHQDHRVAAVNSIVFSQEGTKENVRLSGRDQEMMKRLWLLLAAMLVASMMLAAPVFATSDGDHSEDDEKVCVLREDGGDEEYLWIYEDDKEHGDEIVADKYCDDDHDEDGTDEHDDNDE